MTQTSTFENEVRRIYFGVDVFNRLGSAIDSFKSIRSLKYNDTVVYQWNLNRTIATKKTRMSSHKFSFAKSALPDTKIHSGQIIARIEETGKLKTLILTELLVNFEAQSDAETYFQKLREVFMPISTEQNMQQFEDGRQTAHYSYRKESEKSKQNILVSLQISPNTKNSQIVIRAFNSVEIE